MNATSDPHDKVFALLGLIGDGIELRIDYEEPYLLTFARAIYLAIKQARNTGKASSLQVLTLVDPAPVHLRQYRLSWVPDFGYSMQSLGDCVEQTHVWTTPKGGAAEDRQCFMGTKLSKTICLKFRAVLVAIVGRQMCPGPEMYNVDIVGDLQRLTLPYRYLFTPILSTSWWTDRGWQVTAHKVCRRGEGIYVMAGLNQPCVMRKRENSECVFKGLASIGIDGDLNPSDPKLQYSQKYPGLDDVNTQILRCLRCLDSSLSEADVAREYNAWCRGEDKEYPWTTEELVLI